MIEILQFALSTNLGGIETYLKKVWDNIDRSKFHFSFVDMTGEGNKPYYYDYFRECGCNFYKVTPRNVSLSQNRKDFDKLFFGHRFDILHFSVNTLSYIKPVELALKHGVKVIVHSRCSAFPDSKLTHILHNINRLRIRKMDVEHIAISNQAGEWMFKGIPYKVYPNCVDTAKFYYHEDMRYKIRHEFKCEGRKIIGHVGTFIPTKNHEFILSVFEEIHRRDKSFVLWLVGEGPLKEKIINLAEEKGLKDSVFFLGRRDDMEVIYSGMDMFLFPSIYEGLGNVVLEAEAEGLPCLISDGIPQETLIARNTSSLSISDSPAKWASEIISLMNMNIDRSSGKKTIEDAGWSVEVEIERLQNLYLSLLH